MRDLQSFSSMSSSCQMLVRTLTCAALWHPSSFPSCSYADRPDLAPRRFLPRVDKHWWPSAGSGSLGGPFTERAATVSSSQRSVVVSESLPWQLGTMGQNWRMKSTYILRPNTSAEVTLRINTMWQQLRSVLRSRLQPSGILSGLCVSGGFTSGLRLWPLAGRWCVQGSLGLDCCPLVQVLKVVI